MLGGSLCPWCRYYNAVGDKACGRCGHWLPPPGLSGALRSALGVELWATKLLAGVNILVFALEMVASLRGGGGAGIMSVPGSVLLRFGAIPWGYEASEPFRLLAACFVHMSVLHIAMNMLAFADLGRASEPAVGGPRLVVTYVVTGVLGFVASRWWSGVGGTPYSLTAGASGAVFGVAGLLVATRAMRRDKTWRDMLARMVVYIVVTSLVPLPINNGAHVGGLVSGLVLGVLFALENRPWRLAPLFYGLTALSLVAIATSLGLSMRSPLWRAAAASEEAYRERIRFPEFRLDPPSR